MTKHFLLAILAIFIFFASCKQESEPKIEIVTPIEFKNDLDQKNLLQLIDVRTPDEYDVGHLKDAQNICVTASDFKEKVKTLNKEEPVYVYCKSGGRSANAAKILQEMGFKKVYDLDGGITNWKSEGLEVTQ